MLLWDFLKLKIQNTLLKIVKNMAISFFTAKKQVITIIYKMRIKFKSKKETNMKLMDFSSKISKKGTHKVQ